MRKKIAIIGIMTILYGIFISFGFIFLDDFSDYAFIASLIYFGILILNFYCLRWKNNLIAEFIIEKKLNPMFLGLTIIYLVAFIVSFFYADGLDRIMFCTIWISIINICLCNYIYLL